MHYFKHLSRWARHWAGRTLGAPLGRSGRWKCKPKAADAFAFDPLEDRTTPATITVTNTLDVGANGDGVSLFEAIQSIVQGSNFQDVVATGAYGNNDTINISLAGGSAGKTITATTPREFSRGGAVYFVTNNKTLTINGNGVTITRSDMSSEFRFFRITAGSNVTLNGLTLSNGTARGGQGGGGGGGGAGMGGAIFNEGTLTIVNSLLTGNKAIGGSIFDANAQGGGGGLDGPGFAGSGGSPNGGAVGAGSGATGGSGGVGGGGGAGGGGNSFGGNGGFGGGGGAGTGNRGGGFGGFGGGAGNLNTGGFGGGEGGGTNGGAGGAFGGAIYNRGTLTVTNSTIAANSATGGSASQGGFAGRSGSAFGGGIANVNGTLTINNSTLSGNSIARGPGIDSNDAPAGGQIFTASINDGLSSTGAALTLANSILANSGSVADLANLQSAGTSTVTGNGPNIVTSVQGSVSGTAFTTSNPNLAALADNGGLSRTLALQTGSPAINAGDNSKIPGGITTDQRGAGFPRIVNTTVDLGAFEFVVPPFTGPLIVSATTDVSDGNFADGQLSLREAVELSNSLAGNDPITFSATVFATAKTITLVNGRLSLTDSTTITGPGAALLTIDANNLSGVFVVNTGVTASISGVTVTKGRSGNGGGIENFGTLTVDQCVITANSTTVGNGGGIENNAGTLTVTNSTISGNTAVQGGGINNFQGALTVSSSTISGNTATTNSGGGIITFGAGSSLTMTNSTVSGNASPVTGGGIAIGGSTATITNCTITLNGADSDNNANNEVGGGIALTAGDNVKLFNTIVAGNFVNANVITNPAITSDDIFGTVDPMSSFNLISDNITNGGLVNGTNGNQVGDGAGSFRDVTQVLDFANGIFILKNNGGPTLTHTLAAGSPALNAGSNANVPSGVTTDQRGTGFARLVGTVDIGAIEVASPGTIQFNAATFSVNETATSIVITVTRTGGSSGAASVQFATADVTATAGSDYTAANGTLNWTDGDGASKTFTITITNDTFVEVDETVRLSLTNVTGATLGAQAIVSLTIVSDDAVPPVLVGVTDAVDKVFGNRLDPNSSARSLLFYNANATAGQPTFRLVNPSTGALIGQAELTDTATYNGPNDRALVDDVVNSKTDDIVQFNRNDVSGATPTGPFYRVIIPQAGNDFGVIFDTFNYSETPPGGTQTFAQIMAEMVDPEDEVFLGRFTQSTRLEALFFNRTNQNAGSTSIIVIDVQTGAVVDRGLHNNLNFGGFIDPTDEITVSDTNFDGLDDLVFVNRVANPGPNRATNLGFVGMVSLAANAGGRNGTDIGFYRFFDWNFAKPGENSVFPGFDEQNDRATFGVVVNNGVRTPVIVLVNSQSDGNPAAAAYALLQPAPLVQGVRDSFQLISTQFRNSLPASSFDPDDQFSMVDIDGDRIDEFLSYSKGSGKIVLRNLGAFNGQIVSQIPPTGNGNDRPVTRAPAPDESTPASVLTSSAVDSAFDQLADRRHFTGAALEEMEL